MFTPYLVRILDFLSEVDYIHPSICNVFCVFSHKVLEMTTGIEHAGGIRWELFGLLVLAWAIVYFCIFKGVKSTGKVRVQRSRHIWIDAVCFIYLS